jgi:hypothetical protein
MVPESEEVVVRKEVACPGSPFTLTIYPDKCHHRQTNF